MLSQSGPGACVHNLLRCVLACPQQKYFVQLQWLVLLSRDML